MCILLLPLLLLGWEGVPEKLRVKIKEEEVTNGLHWDWVI